MRHWAVLLYEKWDKADLEKFDVVSKNGDDFMLTHIVIKPGEEITCKTGQKQLKPEKWATGVIVEWDDKINGDLKPLIEAAGDAYNKKYQNALDKTKLYYGNI